MLGATSDATTRSLSVPLGWSVDEWTTVPGASMMAWTPAGDLLVSSPTTGNVYRVHPIEGQQPQISVLVAGLNKPFGLALSQAHSLTTLVIGTADRVIAYTLDGATVQSPRVLASGLPAGADDPLTSIAISPDGTQVYYGISATSDAGATGAETADDDSGLIMRVAIAGGAPQVVARGAKDPLGLDFAPDGSLYAAVGGVDDAPYPYHKAIDRYADGYGKLGTSWAAHQPSDQVTQVKVGDNLGWPYCLVDSQSSATQLTAQVNLGYVANPETNPGDAQLDCSRLPNVQAGLPAHSEPTSLRFLFDTAISSSMINGALVVAHGSSSGTSPRAPGVYYLTWNTTTKQLGSPTLLISGFQQLNGSRTGRSVDAIVGPTGDGRIYLTDDQTGTIYRFTPPA